MLILDELKQRLENHTIWLENNGEKGERLNLSYTILKDVDLSKANLKYAIMTNMEIENCKFNKATLQYANLSNCEIKSCDFNSAIMNYMVMNKASIIDSDLSNATIQKAELSNSRFTNVKAYYADMFNTNLSGSVLENVNLFRALLSYSNLTNAILNEVYMYDVNFDHTKGIHISMIYDNNGYRIHLFKYKNKLMVSEGLFWGTINAYRQHIRKINKNKEFITDIKLIKNL